MYPFDGLHLLVISVFPVRASDLAAASRVTVGVLLARCVAVCFEKSERSMAVSSALLVLIENRPRLQASGRVFLVGDVSQ